MKPRYQASQAAIDLIKRFEGFRSKAAPLPDGRWMIGYGHTQTAREGAEVSEADAEALLVYDIAAIAKLINEGVFTPLSQNQVDALTAFIFNIGPENFRRSSVRRRLNEGAMVQSACAMEMWRTAEFDGESIVVDALVRRRAAEMALFLTPQDGFVPVPSLLVRPRVDEGVAHAAPGRLADDQGRPDQNSDAVRLDTPPPPSASQAAADAVSARLSAIFPELAAEPSDLSDAAPIMEAAATDTILIDSIEPDALPDTPTAPESALSQPVPPALAADDAPVEAERPTLDLGVRFADSEAPRPGDAARTEPLIFVELDDEHRRLAWSSAPLDAVAARRKPRTRTPAPLFVVLALVGLIAFAGGIFWSFNAKASERGALSDPVATGWTLGLFGVCLLAISVYVLIDRLRGRTP